jgi:hypothetical protein
VAFPFDRERMNTLSSILPAGLARGILPAEEEAVFWREWFDIDCICDNEGLSAIQTGIIPVFCESLLCSIHI